MWGCEALSSPPQPLADEGAEGRGRSGARGAGQPEMVLLLAVPLGVGGL